MTGRAKRSLLFLAGLLTGIAILFSPLRGIPHEGRVCLALTLTAVVWWAGGVMNPGFTALALLLGFQLLIPDAVAPPSMIFGLWTSPTIYLVIGGFLIAEAVGSSGLGKRLALHFVRRFVRGYRGLIISCYLLGLLLSLLIPHPWPRSFLLASVMLQVARSAGLEQRYIANVGLAVFAGSVPTAMVLLTGDSTLNPAAVGFAGVNAGWTEWVWYMGLPGLLATVLTCAVQLLLFGAPKRFSIEPQALDGQLGELGPMGGGEKKVLGAVLAAMALWALEGVHGIASGWVAAGAVVLLAIPLIGSLEGASWGCVNLGTLFFLTAGLSIGAVGGATGMNQWLTDTFLPARAPTNTLVFALAAAVVCMLLHMVMGSALAVMSIAAPAIIVFGSGAGIPPLACSLIAYTAVVLHWLLPFHHMNILVGMGEAGGGFTQREVLRMGLAQTAVVLIVVAFAVCWWRLIGLV